MITQNHQGYWETEIGNVRQKLPDKALAVLL